MARALLIRQSGLVTVETRTVWVEELDCCGDPFALGSTVTWEAHSVDDDERRFLSAVFGEDTAARITDGYERQGQFEPTRDVVGIVHSIEAGSWQIHPLADDSAETDALGHIYGFASLPKRAAFSS